MKKLLLTTAIVMSFGTTAAFAHHPAEEMVDPITYAMIDDNVSDIHRDMDFEDVDMGGTTEVGGAAESRDADVEMGENLPDVGSAEESRVEMNAMADAEGSGPMGANAQKQYCPDSITVDLNHSLQRAVIIKI